MNFLFVFGMLRNFQSTTKWPGWSKFTGGSLAIIASSLPTYPKTMWSYHAKLALLRQCRRTAFGTKWVFRTKNEKTYEKTAKNRKQFAIAIAMRFSLCNCNAIFFFAMWLFQNPSNAMWLQCDAIGCPGAKGCMG